MHIFYYAGRKFGEVMGVSLDTGSRGARRWPSIRCIVAEQRVVELHVEESYYEHWTWI